jgi:hypothetical protein
MSSRVIRIPLSGGDRKHYARELRRVESLPHFRHVRRGPASGHRNGSRIIIK